MIGEEAVLEREAKTDVWAKVQKITIERLEHIKKKAKEKVKEADENGRAQSMVEAGWLGKAFKREEP